MADISFDKAEGFYFTPFTAKMILSGNVQSLQYSVNGAPPSISKYVAYDQLTPPNPFIAVTQDGTGNVVYDGGFPKFYNSYAPAEGIKDSVSVEFNGTCSGVASEGANGNCFYYNQFAADIVTIASGDKLVYDVMTNHANVRTGIDALTNAAPSTMYYSMRDWGIDYANLSKPYGLKDQNGLNIHPAADLSAVAVNKWYHREIDLTKCAGYTFRKWTMAHEADVAGEFSARYRDIYIVDKNGKIKTTLFKDTLKLTGNTNTEFGASGYSNLTKVVYDPRSQLTASYKYLYNAILWASSEKKLSAGNRKILILGDVTSDMNYSIKSAGANGFQTSLTRLCATVGFTPTFKDTSDYTGAVLNPTLAELEQYACVLVMSTYYTTNGLISDEAVRAMITYRENGSGIILITDHGPVIADVAHAHPTTGAFFATANKIAREFGAYFSGNYDRTPVNVGFLRTTYGDHPLYAGMDDSESINAGSSESRVQVATYESVLPAQVPAFNVPVGRTIIQAAVLLKSGAVVAFRIIYNVVTLKMQLTDGKSSWGHGQALDVGARNQSILNVSTAGVLEEIGAGVVYKNNVRVGAFTYGPTTGIAQTWDDGTGGGSRKVLDGDVYRVDMTSPVALSSTMTVKRFQPAIKGKLNIADTMNVLRAYQPALTDIRRIKKIISEIAEGVPWLGLKHEVNIPIDLQLLGNYFTDEGLASQVLPDALTKPYTADSRPWAATGGFSRQYPVNPVTSQTIDFKNFLFSPVYGSEKVPGNFKLDYYANVFIPAGSYRIWAQADDIFDFYADGVQKAKVSGFGTADVTFTESRFYALKVSNTNVPNNTPSWWTCAMVNLATGEILLRPEPGMWKTQEYSIA